MKLRDTSPVPTAAVAVAASGGAMGYLEAAMVVYLRGPLGWGSRRTGPRLEIRSGGTPPIGSAG